MEDAWKPEPERNGSAKRLSLTRVRSYIREIDEPNFIEHLYVGLQLKERVKGLIPTKIIQKLKSL